MNIKIHWEKDWNKLLDKWGVIALPNREAKKHTKEMKIAWTNFIREERVFIVDCMMFVIDKYVDNEKGRKEIAKMADNLVGKDRSIIMKNVEG